MVNRAFTISRRDVIFTWIKRKIWSLLFSRQQYQLGPFFIDPRDHMGSERLITGNSYECANLTMVSNLAKDLNLSRGVCVDIGSNIGNHAVFFSKIFDSVVCFEPGDVSFHVLSANILSSGSSNCIIHKCALGSVESLGTLVKISDTNLGSSKVSLDDASGDIEIKVGDNLFVSSSSISLIKIDVEGSEIDVLKGLEGTIDKHQPIICIEVLSPENLDQVKRILGGLGYVRFYALCGQPSAGMVNKIRYLLFGKCLQFMPIPDKFPASGFDMIFCMTNDHASRLDELV